MVRALDAVLLLAGKTELAPPTDTALEADADVLANLDIVAAAGAESDDAADAFVAAEVGKFDVENGFAVWTSGGAGLGVEVCEW